MCILNRKSVSVFLRLDCHNRLLTINTVVFWLNEISLYINWIENIGKHTDKGTRRLSNSLMLCVYVVLSDSVHSTYCLLTGESLNKRRYLLITKHNQI